MNDDDLGGEAPCWAHLLDDLGGSRARVDTLADVAQQLAAVMVGSIDPVATAAREAARHHAVEPFEPQHLAQLEAAVRDRLRSETDDADLHRIAALIEATRPEESLATYRDACGFVPIAAQPDIERFLGSAEFDPAPMVEAALGDADIVDWSAGAVRRTDRRTDWDDGRARLGRYGELRSIYDTPAFDTPFGERRTLHLGIDVFVPDGDAVCSPLEGVVHSADVRDLRGDYGGVVLFEYRTTEDVPFWMLVGHLDHDSARDLAPGDVVGRGELFASVGTRAQNGGWAPHIHVQLFTDLLGMSTDLDGVARASQASVWTSISPNPAALIVGVDELAVDARRSTPG